MIKGWTWKQRWIHRSEPHWNALILSIIYYRCDDEWVEKDAEMNTDDCTKVEWTPLGSILTPGREDSEDGNKYLEISTTGLMS